MSNAAPIGGLLVDPSTTYSNDVNHAAPYLMWGFGDSLLVEDGVEKSEMACKSQGLPPRMKEVA